MPDVHARSVACVAAHYKSNRNARAILQESTDTILHHQQLLGERRPATLPAHTDRMLPLTEATREVRIAHALSSVCPAPLPC